MSTYKLKDIEALEAELMETLLVAQREWQAADADSKQRKKETWVRALRTFSGFVVDGLPPSSR